MMSYCIDYLGTWWTEEELYVWNTIYGEIVYKIVNISLFQVYTHYLSPQAQKSPTIKPCALITMVIVGSVSLHKFVSMTGMSINGPKVGKTRKYICELKWSSSILLVLRGLVCVSLSGRRWRFQSRGSFYTSVGADTATLRCRGQL